MEKRLPMRLKSWPSWGILSRAKRKFYQPGSSAGELFGMVKTWLFKRLSDLQLRDQKVTNWITWKFFFVFFFLGGVCAKKTHTQNTKFMNVCSEAWKASCLRAFQGIPPKNNVNYTRWAPTSYKWRYNPYKWPYKWVTGVITLLIEVIIPFRTSRGPPCMICFHFSIEPMALYGPFGCKEDHTCWEEPPVAWNAMNALHWPWFLFESFFWPTKKSKGARQPVEMVLL